MFQISYFYMESESMLDNQDLHILWKWRTARRKGFFFCPYTVGKGVKGEMVGVQMEKIVYPVRIHTIITL